MHSSAWKWWVCSALLLATFLNYMDRQALAVTLPQFKADYQLHERRVGWLEGSFGFAFAAGSIAFGLLADRFGPRLLYPVVLLGWSAAGIATGFAGHAELTSVLESPGDEEGAGTFRWLVLCRTVLGLFEAGHWPCALITAQRILSAKDRPLGNGILQSGAALGAIIIPLYVQLAEQVGLDWRFVFWSVGVGGLLWIPVWLSLIQRDDLQKSSPSHDESQLPERDESSGFVRRVIVLGTIVACLTISWQFLRAWLTLYVQDYHKYEPFDTRLVQSGYFIVADGGCLLVGLLVRSLQRRGYEVHAARVTAFALYCGLTLVAAAVPYLGGGAWMIAGLWVAGAGILGLHPLYYSLSQELPAKRMGTFSGLLAAGGWVISAVFQILIGDRIKETRSYDLAFLIAGVAPLIGLAALLLLWRPVERRDV